MYPNPVTIFCDMSDTPSGIYIIKVIDGQKIVSKSL